jgi:GNAT superfamily N-acetyltransferase
MSESDDVDISSHGRRPIDPESVRTLYAAEGWWPGRTAADLASVLAGGPAVGAWVGERLVGFARAVTDRRFRAYIEDVVVADDQRGQGLGGMLLHRLHEELRDVEVVSLFCDANLVGFYRGLGYEPTRQVVLHRRRGRGSHNADAPGDARAT